MDLLYAWVKWSAGEKLADGTLLWGIKMLWWGRIGLIVQIIGAAMVVFDLLSLDRVKKIIESTVDMPEVTPGEIVLMIFALTLGVIVSDYVISSIAITPFLLLGSLKLITRMTSHPRLIWLSKAISWLFVLVGSHFVLLTS